MESVNGLLGPKFTDFKHNVREFTKEIDKTLKVAINYCHEKMVGDRVELLHSAVKIIKIAVPFVFFFQRPIVFVISTGIAFTFTYQKHSAEIIQQIKELWDRAGHNFHATALLLTIAAHQVVPLAIFGIVSTSFVGILSGIQGREIFDQLREYFKHEPQQEPQGPQQPQGLQVPPGREGQKLLKFRNHQLWIPNFLPLVGQQRPQAPQQPVQQNQAIQPQAPQQPVQQNQAIQPQAPQQPVQQNQAIQPQAPQQPVQQNQANQPQIPASKTQLAIDTTVAIVSNTIYYGGQAIKGAGTVAKFSKKHYPQVIAVGRTCYGGAKTCLSKMRSMGSSLLPSATQPRKRTAAALHFSHSTNRIR